MVAAARQPAVAAAGGGEQAEAHQRAVDAARLDELADPCGRLVDPVDAVEGVEGHPGERTAASRLLERGGEGGAIL
ncbi:MAG: hypothetical protein ACREQ5_25950, partial [Candidatus Dormibacteria bacterium]